MTHRRLVPALIALIGLIAAGCDRQPATDEVIATVGDHDITLADIDRAILDMPPQQRWPADKEAAEWYAEVARREAVARLLLEQARLVGAENEPEFQPIARRIRRKAYSDHFLAEHGPPNPIGDEDIRAYFEANRERFERPERRLVYHIYKHCTDAQDCERVVAKLKALRAQALDGRRFQELAAAHSESETRHRDGRIGSLTRGRLSEDFDRVVFSLPEGVPSEPVRAGGGVHLFYVDNAIAAQRFSVEDISARLRRLLWAERSGARLAELVSDLPVPADSLIPDWQQALRLRRDGPDTEILRIGDFVLTAGAFQRQLNDELRELGPRHIPNYAERRFDEIKYREIVYQNMREEGVPEIVEALAQDEIDRELTTYFAEKRMRLLLGEQTDRLTRHHEANRMRFTTPLRLTVERLSVPQGDDPETRMAELERAHGALQAGDTDLASLAAAMDGQVEEIGPVAVTRLAVIDPKIPLSALPLEVGEFSSPYRLGNDRLALFRLAERLEPRPLAYPLVRDQVLAHYLEIYAPRVFEELSSQVLDEADFQLHLERIPGQQQAAVEDAG